MSQLRRWTTVIAAFVCTALPTLGLANPAAALPQLSGAAAAPGSIKLAVASARTVGGGSTVHQGDPVTAYKWLINADDTGDPGTVDNQNLASCLPRDASGNLTGLDVAVTCPWPSVRTTSGQAPIIAQGDESTLSTGTALDGLPPGKYLVSVTADNYKIDGAHFTVAAGSTQTVHVDMQPTPLPLVTLKIQVFQDSVPVDATYEVGAEQGLSGFTAHLSDVFGAVSTDYYGNALCTKYQHTSTGAIAFDANGKPIVDSTSTGRCVSDAAGVVTIPNLGPNRYAATVTPPAGQSWVQTTTLEGGHDHDIWSQEGDTGFDTEVTKGAEPVPMVQFGFVKPQALPALSGVTGEIVGRVNAQLPYIGGLNGQVGPEGLAGSKLGPPIKAPWVALSDLNRGDGQVYVGRGAADGSFDIKNVPNGTYQLTLWDDDQDYILFSFTVEVTGGAKVDVRQQTLVGWFTHIQGTIFTDANGNGQRDSGEAGVPGFTLTVRERDNSTIDQGTNTVTTDANGHYDIKETYPLGKWLVLEAFNTRYQTTGVTYRGDNEPSATTKLGGLVDFDFLPIIGLGATVDWGVQPFATNTNGGIAGTVSYDTTRNELDPADAVSESYQPGVPDIQVHLYQSKPCTATDPAEIKNSCRQGYEIVPLNVPDPTDPTQTIVNPDPNRGAFARGLQLNTYTTETWAAPRGCTARMYNGVPLTDQLALPQFGETANKMCVESPMMGVAMGPSDTTDPSSASQTVNGNYGFTGSTVNMWPVGDPRNTHDLAVGEALPPGEEQDLPPAAYIVGVDIPDNPVGGGAMYKVTSEADVNVFTGDAYLPQENFPPSASQATDPPPGDTPTATPPSQPPSQQAGIISPCGGPLYTVNVTDPDFLANGGSPFQGQERPSCQDKLVTVRSGQTTAPNFNLFTPVPLPTHFWGLTLNDLGITLDKRSVNYGEAQGLPYVPVGLYDWSGRLVDTAHTDFNGLYEALEPSTGTYNCPVPAGPCPNMYRFVGNDPGGPGAPNKDYNPRFRTIAANFQGWPGLYTVTDEAPTQVAATVLTPGATVANNTVCNLPGDVPQLYAVDKPVVRGDAASAASRTVTVQGSGFGGTAGTLQVGSTAVTPASWSDTQIQFVVPNLAAVVGAQPLTISRSAANNGKSATNTLTLQVLRGTGNTPTNPRLFEVGPGRAYATVQQAVTAARPTAASRYNLVVVYPGAPTALTPRGEYLENVIVADRIHLQGVGPGGFQGNTWVPGTILDGSGFNPENPIGASWLATLSGLSYNGDPAVPDAAVLTFLNRTTAPAMAGTWRASVDGFQITGGAQSDFAGNVNVLTGGTTTPYGAAGALVTQGGGIYVHAGVQSLRVTDNLVVGNGGSYGGGIRVGTPYVANNNNHNVVISHNQVRDNGGTNLAGGIGLFADSDGYSVDNNAICGNHSAEYGGGVSAFGFMGNGGNGGGTISHNRIWFNQSYDEGGGVMVAGELPSTPTGLTPGTGPVTIDANVIQANLANDDGGGIRLLQVSGSNMTRTTRGTVDITNNTVANNVSAHEGGGIAIDDAVFVNVVNTTVTKNITTATAVTSNGVAVAAGLTTGAISAPLQARLNTAFSGNNLLTGSQKLGFSRPTLLNDVFWDNRAGNYVGGVVYGIGAKLPNGSTDAVNNADMEVVDVAAGSASPVGALHPVNTVVQTTSGTDGGQNMTVSAANPGLVDPYDVAVSVLPVRTNPAFRQAAIVTEVLPFDLLGNYHLTGSGAIAYGAGAVSYQVTWNTGAPVAGTVSYQVYAPAFDIDGDPRPVPPAPAGRIDAGSDQVVP
ncbi:MAG TPA: SdrD B-like domain-containing protein [Dermatophilaceae bacterium]|nr:SdrD B-like domain-containing protein [Dermatophilaceae bacterium]